METKLLYRIKYDDFVLVSNGRCVVLPMTKELNDFYNKEQWVETIKELRDRQPN